MIRDARLFALVTSFASGARVGIGICHILEGDCTFDIFSSKNRLILPFHKDLDVGGHGGVVFAYEGSPGLEWPSRTGSQRGMIETNK